METVTKIRRRHKVNGESISSIARDLNLSRNTVRKYLKQSEPPDYERRNQPKPKLGDYEPILLRWLEQDAERPKRQRRTARRLFEDLQCEGYSGAYDSVQRFVKGWKQVQRPSTTQAFIPLVFPPADAAQFDWSHEQVELGGVVQTIKLAHFRLSHSRQCFLVAYPRESQEMIFDAHNRAFTFFGGVPKRMIYDNPRTIVDTVFLGKQRRFNHRFLALANHYLFEPVACTPGSGWEKGQVENQVGNIRERLFSPRPRFKDFEALNQWLQAQSLRLSQRAHPEQKSRTIEALFAEEQTQLRSFGRPFEGYFEQSCRASSTCTVAYDRNRYSVPAEYARQRVSLRATATHIRVVADGKQIAEHQRSFGRDRQILDPWHYLPLLERKPGALRNGAPFQDWKLPAPITKVKAHLLKQPKGDRAFVEVLLALHEYGSELLSVACELALEHHTVNAAVVLNHVHRLSAPTPVRSWEKGDGGIKKWSRDRLVGNIHQAGAFTQKELRCRGEQGAMFLVCLIT
ncbi:MAG: IS21 family transposase [Candidatus Sedimenticola endophacoides]